VANKRKGLSKKLRFEVFKRDSFKCQYCGNTSPDVILEVDHIKPVKEGGTNDITNLITACGDCNSGKGANLLSDDSAIKKQHKQLEELNERRLQLEMMMDWRNGLRDIEQDKIDSVSKYWEGETCYTLNENGIKKMKKLIKKYGVETILNAIDRAVAQYAIYDEDGSIPHNNVEKIFDKVGRIANMLEVEKEKPYIQDLLYIRGILRNRLNIDKDIKRQTVGQKIKLGNALKLLEAVYCAYRETLNREHEQIIGYLKSDMALVETYEEFEEEMNLNIDYIESKVAQGLEGI